LVCCFLIAFRWEGEQKIESWNPSGSTLLQVLVSLQGLVLNEEPYFNEAGYESLRKTESHQLSSQRYTEKVYLHSYEFIKYALENKPLAVEDILQWLYLSKDEYAPHYLDQAIENLEGVVQSPGTLRAGMKTVPSKGALMILQRKLEALKQLRKDKIG
jgi:ubiquitin-conjugating enzyme E2 O